MQTIPYYDSLIEEWFTDSKTLVNNDPYLSTQTAGQGLLYPSYYSCMPEPFLGDTSHNLAVIMNLNPGYTGPGKKNVLSDDVILSKESMSEFLTNGYTAYASSFPHLCPNPHHKSAASWWLEKTAWLEHLINLDHTFTNTYHIHGGIQWPDVKPFAIELCPWHSHRWCDAKINSFTPQMKQHIESNVLALAADAVANSELEIIVGLGDPIFEAAKQCGFADVKTWESSKDHSGWPRVQKKGSNTEVDVHKKFRYLKRQLKDGRTIKLLQMQANCMKTPSERFDDVLVDILKYIRQN